MNLYKDKYLKYKNKYLQLKFNLMTGGSLSTAKTLFNSRLKKFYNPVSNPSNYTSNSASNNVNNDFVNNESISIRNIFLQDKYLNDRIPNLANELPDQLPVLPADKSGTIDYTQIPIFGQIFDVIKDICEIKPEDREKPRQIEVFDIFCKLYLSNNLGNPNSMENVGRLKDALLDNNLLGNDKIKNIMNINSLKEIEDYVESKRHILEKKEEYRNYQKQRQIKLEQEGVNDVNKLLETNNVIIYNPTSEAGAKYYGRNTKWCTAADENNMFNHYNNLGPIYIIELKKVFDSNRNRVKYQFHFDDEQFMDSSDEEVNFIDVINQVNDLDFNNWLYNSLVNFYNKILYYDNPNLSNILTHMPVEYKQQIKKLYCCNNDIDFIDNVVQNLTGLEVIVFSNFFNSPIENIIRNKPNLKKIRLGIYFSQELGDSLNNLTNLEFLEIPRRYEVEIERLKSEGKINPNLEVKYL